MNQIRTDEETVENRILKIIHLDEQIAGLNNEAQHLTGDLEQRRADGRRINMERRRKNAERRRILQEIISHTPTRPVLRRTMPLTLSPVTSRVDVPIYEHGSPISTSPNSPTSLHMSDLELSLDSVGEIIDVDNSPPGSPPYAPGSPIYAPGSPDNSPPGSPIYAPGSPDNSPPGSPIYAPGSPDNSPPGPPNWRQLLSNRPQTPTQRREIFITPPPRSPQVPSAPPRSRHRSPVGGTKKRKGKKRKATKKKIAKKGKKTKKR